MISKKWIKKIRFGVGDYSVRVFDLPLGYYIGKKEAKFTSKN